MIWATMLLLITEHILHKIFRIYLVFCWIKHCLRIRISSRACFIWLYWNEVNFYVRPNCTRASYRRGRELGTCRTFSVRPDCLAFRKFCCFDEQNFIYTRCRIGSVVYITSVQKQQPYRKQRLNYPRGLAWSYVGKGFCWHNLHIFTKIFNRYRLKNAQCFVQPYEKFNNFFVIKKTYWQIDCIGL